MVLRFVGCRTQYYFYENIDSPLGLQNGVLSRREMYSTYLEVPDARNV